MYILRIISYILIFYSRTTWKSWIYCNTCARTTLMCLWEVLSIPVCRIIGAVMRMIVV